MPASPKALRTRNMTAAKRSMSLIEEAVAEHRKALDAGEVPESGFAVYVIKYEQALAALRALGALGGDAPDDGTVEVRRESLAVLITLLRWSEVGFAIQDVQDDSPLGDVLAAAYPDGLPDAPGPEQEG